MSLPEDSVDYDRIAKEEHFLFIYTFSNIMNHFNGIDSSKVIGAEEFLPVDVYIDHYVFFLI